MLEILSIGTYRNPVARQRSQHLDWHRKTRACGAARRNDRKSRRHFCSIHQEVGNSANLKLLTSNDLISDQLACQLVPATLIRPARLLRYPSSRTEIRPSCLRVRFGQAWRFLRPSIKSRDLARLFRSTNPLQILPRKFRRVLPLSSCYVYSRYASFSRPQCNCGNRHNHRPPMPDHKTTGPYYDVLGHSGPQLDYQIVDRADFFPVNIFYLYPLEIAKMAVRGPNLIACRQSRLFHFG